MSDDRFEADWLTLRESVDHRSRAGAFADTLADEGAARGWRRVVDLGGGTGSNLRWLHGRLPWATEWVIVDHDPELLARVEAPEDGTLEVVVGDLAREGLAAVRRTDVVSASALLDLVSREWLARLADAVRGRGVGILFALSYDGRVEWADGDAEDAFVLGAVNRHQHREKGLGAALGPDATDVAVELLEAARFRCEVASTPWRLSGVEDAPLTLRLMEGWRDAAREIEPGAAARLDAWFDARAERVRAGAYDVEVGHRDLLALPTG